MRSDLPHLYRRQGLEQGVPEQVLDAVLAAASGLRPPVLPSVVSLKHLAHQTGAPYGLLRKTVERTIDPYVEFSRSRRNGGRLRTISSPTPGLMHVQRWLLREILAQVPQHPASFAYERGKSALVAAERHLGAKWLLKFDLHNFFGSIDERQVYRVFKGLGYAPLPSFEMTRLCTRPIRGSAHITPPDADSYSISAYRAGGIGVLPQGAPTSGALANMVAAGVDSRLSEYGMRQHLVYSRYADDIVLSSLAPFNRTIAESCVADVRRLIVRCGFTMHEKKTRVVPPGARQVILGLVLTPQGLRLRREVKSRIEAHVRGVEVFGLADHARHRRFESILGMIHHVDGLLAYATDVDPVYAQPLVSRWLEAVRSVRLLAEYGDH